MPRKQSGGRKVSEAAGNSRTLHENDATAAGGARDSIAAIACGCNVPGPVSVIEINLEADIDKKLKMLLSFQHEFPTSQVLPEIFTSIMDTYSQHRNAPAAWYSQKLLKEEAAGIALLVQTSKTFAALRNLTSAVDYAEQAVGAAAALKERRPPVPYDGPAWESWARSVESDASRQLASLAIDAIPERLP